MDVYLKYANGQESILTDCTVTVKQDYEDICSYEWGNQTVPIGKQYLTVEVPMTTFGDVHYGTWDNVSGNFYYPDYAYKHYRDFYWDHARVDSHVTLSGDLTEPSKTKERRDKMISRKIFNEALAEAGVDKGTRRKVEKLNEEDFQYLLATLLAKAFDPGMLAVFEPDVQKVKVVEDA